jgi:voltage-gated potassium channel
MSTRTSRPGEEPSIWKRRSLRQMFYGLAALVVVVLAGTLGFVAAGWSLSDAFYMVMISVTTVGYGEVRPLDSGWERVMIIAVIALGTVAVAYTVGNLVAFLTEGEIYHYLGHQRVRKQIDALDQHVIVAGYGRMGSLLCSELAKAEVPFVLIESGMDRRDELDRAEILYLIGDATEEEILRQAGIDRARALVSTIPSDAHNVFITLTARQMAPHVQIMTRAEQPSTQKKLRQAGANHVVLPASIGAHRLASLLTNPSAVEFTELVTQRSSLAIQMEEVPVAAGGLLAGKTLRDADIGRRTGVIVIAVKRADGQVEFPPPGDAHLEPGDVIVLIGRPANLEQFREAFQVAARAGSTSPARTPGSTA